LDAKQHRYKCIGAALYRFESCPDYKCCFLEKEIVELKRLINQFNYKPYNTEDFSSSKLTYPKVMRKHLVPYVHKVDRNGTKWSGNILTYVILQ
jgi:hypothetical protein